MKYFELKILSRIDFMDTEIKKLRDQKPTIDVYTDRMQELTISSDNSRRILEFFSVYDNGFLRPEKCDAYEPVKDKFNPENLSEPIRWLSQPGGAVYIKKIKKFKFEGVIENHCLAMVWDEKGIPLSKNKDTYSNRDPLYLSEIKLFVDYRITKLKSKDYLFDFFRKLFIEVNGEYGYVYDADGKTLLEKVIE